MYDIKDPGAIEVEVVKISLRFMMYAEVPRVAQNEP